MKLRNQCSLITEVRVQKQFLARESPFGIQNYHLSQKIELYLVYVFLNQTPVFRQRLHLHTLQSLPHLHILDLSHLCSQYFHNCSELVDLRSSFEENSASLHEVENATK